MKLLGGGSKYKAKHQGKAAQRSCDNALQLFQPGALLEV
jgi:hypothetical protein